MIRAEIDNSNNGFGKKVREAKTSRVPYFIIIGDKDIAANKVTLESRDEGQVGQKDISKIVEMFVEKIVKRN
jgi:threonyl-tRNA synthetase